MSPREGPLGPIIFARDEARTQPVDPAHHFKVGTKVVYAFFNFEALRPDDKVTGTWYYGTDLLFKQTLKMTEVFRGTPPAKGHLWLSVRFDQGAAAGSYRLDLSLNDELSESASFAVDRN